VVTSEIESGSVRDVFEEVIVKALLGQDGEIVVKYRMRGDSELPITVENVAWVDEYTFNTTSDLSHVLERFEESEENRDEVQFILGQGSGSSAHISNVTASSLTYSVTLDRPIGLAGELSDVVIDNWRLVPRTMTQDDGECLRFGIGKEGTWGQFKIGFSGKAGYPEIRQILIKTNVKEGL
jgi:hypothetical protein